MFLQKYVKKFWHTRVLKSLTNTVYLRGRLSHEDTTFLKKYKKEYFIPLSITKSFVKKTQENKKSLFLEIGFGNGGHLLYLARKYKNSIVFGCEMYMVGVIKTLRKGRAEQLENIRVSTEDARKVLQKVPAETFKGVYVLFPDPWQKKKHNKRRLVKYNFVKKVLYTLATGGTLTVATDWQDYADEIESMAEQIVREGDVQRIECLPDEKEEIYSTTFAKRALVEGRNIYIVVLQKTS